MVNSFSGGGSRSTRREPSTMGKQLVNCYHLQLRVECTLFCNLQSRARIGDRLVRVVIANDLTHWATRTPAVMYNTSPFQYTPRFYLDRCMRGLWKMSDNVDEWSQTTLQHLKQEMQFKCTTDSCTATFCEKGELLAHQTSHDEQKHIICNYCNKHFINNQMFLFTCWRKSKNLWTLWIEV